MSSGGTIIIGHPKHEKMQRDNIMMLNFQTSKSEMIDWLRSECAAGKNQNAKDLYDVLSRCRSELSYVHFIIRNTLDFYRFGIHLLDEDRVQEYVLHSFNTYFIAPVHCEIYD